MEMIQDAVASQGAIFDEGPGGALFFPRDQEPRQAIVYYHGWSSGVQRSLFRGQVLAMRGQMVLVPSIPLHDWRDPVEPSSRNMALYFWRCVEEAVAEFEDIAAFLAQAYGIAKKDIAVTGHSMGGFIAGGILLHDPDMACGVLYNASLDWAYTQSYFQEVAQDIEDLTPADCAAYRLNPKEHLARFQGKSLFLTNGSEDRVVPGKGNDLFMEAVANSGISDLQIQRQCYEGVGHVMTDHMLHDGLDFMQAYYRQTSGV